MAKIVNNSITIRNSNVSGAVGNNAYSNKKHCDKCGSDDVTLATWPNYQEMCNEYLIKCNKCGHKVKFKGVWYE